MNEDSANKWQRHDFAWTIAGWTTTNLLKFKYKKKCAAWTQQKTVCVFFLLFIGAIQLSLSSYSYLLSARACLLSLDCLVQFECQRNVFGCFFFYSWTTHININILPCFSIGNSHNAIGRYKMRVH